MNTRYFIFLSFKGTAYHGWQIQPNGITVQEVLNEALTTLLGENICTIGAGRTDTGVHAKFFCAHFDTRREELASDQNFVFRLNRYLPDDISIMSVKKVIPDASSRYNAISRTYRYYIATEKDPFDLEFSWFLYGKLSIDDMNKASEVMMKYNDFTSFSRLHSGSKTNICKIHHALWEASSGKLVFTIKADRFLRNMVRSVVGTMTEVGSGKLSLPDFENIIISRNRCNAGMSAPGKGLFLEQIEYPAEIFI